MAAALRLCVWQHKGQQNWKASQQVERQKQRSANTSSMAWLIYEKKLFCSLDQHSEEAGGIVGSFHWLSWATKDATRDSPQFELYQGLR